MSNEEQGYHGWLNGNEALYLQEDQNDGRAKLYMQQDRSTNVLATFHSPEAAQFFMQWVDEVLTLQAEANTELLKRLQNEQPLTFARGSMPHPNDEPDEE